MPAVRAREKRGAPIAVITVAGALDPSQPSEILGMERWLMAHRISLDRPVGPLLPACEAVVVAVPSSVSSRGRECSRVRVTLGGTSAGGPLERWLENGRAVLAETCVRAALSSKLIYQLVPLREGAGELAQGAPSGAGTGQLAPACASSCPL